MQTRGFVRGWAGAGVLLLALGVAGCTGFPRPPAEVTAVVDDAAAMIRSTPGVASVTTDIRVRDHKDGGPLSEVAAWSALLTVQADASGLDPRSLAASVAADGQDGYVSLTTVLQIPGEPGTADVQLQFSPPPNGVLTSVEPREMADAALALSDLPGIGSVSVLQHGEPVIVSVDSPARWADLTETMRAIPGFGSGALTAVTLVTEHDAGESSSLTFDPRSPAAKLVPVLSDLAAAEGVTSVSFDGVDTRKEFSAWRPSLRVLVDTRSARGLVAARLTGLDESDSQSSGLPRASFTASTGGADASQDLRGYLGLPLGSAEPDDRLTGLPGAIPPAAADPAAAAARLELDTALVTTLLDAAGDAAGIRGPASVTTETCMDGSNEQVHGTVVIPIFEIADSADEAFDAITTAWEIGGYIRSDRAMGRDFWSVPDGSLDTLSIRGTADGISIMVTAPCVLL